MNRDTVMKKYAKRMTGFLIVVCMALAVAGCSGENAALKEKITGNWSREFNRNFILLILKVDGKWESSIRVSDATLKIVSSKGKASGSWHIEGNNLIFSVTESDIEDVWGKESIAFHEILLLEEETLTLKSETGQVITYSRHRPKKKQPGLVDTDPIIPMKPIVVNLNKNRSHDKDRYFCLNMNLIIQELMPGADIPKIHPRAHDAAITFLSSLVFEDVRDFDRVKEQKKNLINVLNPYMNGIIKDIDIDHVLIASSIDRVETFIIEHTMTEQTLDPDTEKIDGDLQIQDGAEEENG